MINVKQPSGDLSRERIYRLLEEIDDAFQIFAEHGVSLGFRAIQPDRIRKVRRLMTILAIGSGDWTDSVQHQLETFDAMMTLINARTE